MHLYVYSSVICVWEICGSFHFHPFNVNYFPTTTTKIQFYIDGNLIFNMKQSNQWMIQVSSSSLK